MVEMKSHEETEHLCDDGKRKADFFYAKCSVQSRRQLQPANVVSMKNRTENKGVSSLKLQFDLLLHRPIYIYDQDNF